MGYDSEKIIMELDLGRTAAAAKEAAKAVDELDQQVKEYSETLLTHDAIAKRQLAALEDISQAAGNTRGSGGAGGSGILGISYAVQDFTSQMQNGLVPALGAVQNNIPQILTGLGAGAGMAGVVSVVAVGVGLLYQNWDKLAGAFADTRGKLPELKEGLEGIAGTLKEIDKQIDELDKQAQAGGLNLFDERKLAALRGIKLEGERRQADEKLVSGVGEMDSKATRAIAAAVKEALAETGGGNAAAQNLAMNMGISGREATAVVAGAMRGNATDLQALMAGAPTFGAAYGRISPERRRGEELTKEGARIEEETNRDFARERDAKRKRVEAAQKAEDAGIIQAADEADRAAARGERAGQQAPGVINAAQKTIQATKDLMRRQEVEREINRRGGGRDSYKDIQEAAKRTLDLTGRGVNINQAILVAMREQGAKIQALENLINGQEQQVRQIRQQGRNRQPAGMRRAFPG